ncbi:MAG: hypothetical protein ACTHMS_07935 [Jatrophihabitans sp.]|uniref:hypothetical protein n=1 Tax=Jatrophihabitans sp. TaxID=1932789 RepID=UPI003F805E70
MTAKRSPAGDATTIRAIGLVEAVTGALLATRPNAMITLVDRHRAGPPVWLVRVLGARMLVQGAVEIARPLPVVAMGGAAVDASHALSMLPVVIASRRFRRPASVSGAVAGATAAALLGAFVRATSHADD